MRRNPAARGALLICVVAALLAIFPALASADFPQLRLTHFGTDGDLTQQAGFPDLAFNSQTSQYLLVYEAGPKADQNHWAVYGELLDASGNVVKPEFQISAPTTDYICLQDPPGVTYSAALNQFLVTWNQGNGTCDDTIRAQLVGADGSLIAPLSNQISGTGYSDTETTVPLYNPVSNEWLVAWKSDIPTTTNQEIFAQRLAPDLTQVGTNDQKLTDFTGAGGNADDSISADVDPGTGHYLVVMHGIDPAVGGGQTEAFGHLMTADGTGIGADHFRISHVADTNPTSAYAYPPRVAFDPSAAAFFVTWVGNPMTGSMVSGHYDQFGRMVSSADASLLGTADVRYSDMGPDSSTAFGPARADVGFNPNAHELFMVWHSDDDTPPLVDNELEVFGQRISGSSGAEVGDNDFRISHDGPDGNTAYSATRPALGYNAAVCQYLVAWHAGAPSSSTEEWDVYGNFVDAPCPPVNTAAPAISGTAQAGQQLGCSNGTWTGRGMTFAMQWTNDGADIAGANGANYTLADSDAGHQIACRVTATDPDGSASATSAAVTPSARPIVVPLPVADTTPPVCSARVPRQKLAKVLKKGLRVTVACNEAATANLSLFVSSKALKVGRAARTVRVGKATKRLAQPGKATVVIKLTKKAKKALKSARKVKFTLRMAAVDTAGNHAKAITKRVTVKR